MLAGVNEELLVALAQRTRDGRRLDELGAVADDREDLQEASSARMRADAASAVR
jgi:hypothetical protein